MRKALLSSSEVSALASICIVVLFTLALFLSGFAIQQRTLQDLRAAVRPRDHVSDYVARDGQVQASPRVAASDDSWETERQLVRATEKPSGALATEKQLGILASVQAQAARQSWGVEHPDPQAKYALPITRAERRRLIREEIRRLAQTERPVVYHRRRIW